MYKLCIVVLAVIAASSAKPTLLASPVAYTGLPVAAPLAYTAAAPVVTATSSQYVARNYNGVVAAPLVASPAVYPYAATYPYQTAAYSYPSAAYSYPSAAYSYPSAAYSYPSAAYVV